MLLLIYISLLSLLFPRGSAWTTVVVPHSANDDVPALKALLQQYSTNTTILFQEGVVYNILTPMVFPSLKNVEVVIMGNLSYPTSISTIQGNLNVGIYPRRL
jgi:uracil DNA glycosylase